MGRSSKSGHRHRHDDGDVNSQQRINARDQNESADSPRSQQHHHRRHWDQDRHDDHVSSKERYVVQDESDRRRDRKYHEKKHRRDQSKRKQYNSDDYDSDSLKPKKTHRREHNSRRIDDNSDSSHDLASGKRKKRHRYYKDDNNKQKKSKKAKSQTAVVSDETETTFIDKNKLYSLGERLGHPPDVVLDPEIDYFAQNQRFRLYLYRECGLTFDELSSHDARNKFKDFVQKYNAGELETGYYAPHLPIPAIEECPSTRHQWGLKITNQDSQHLQILQEGVRKQTEYQAAELKQSLSGTSHTNHSKDANETNIDRHNRDVVVNPQHIDPKNSVKNRRLREHVQTTIEELSGGRKEGHERQLEKRQERAAKIHGASRYQQDMVELDDAALYGGNTDDDFRRLAAASKKRAAAQETKKEERILELKQKEQEKQNAMLQMLGLSHKIGQAKIEIQPRNDPPDR